MRDKSIWKKIGNYKYVKKFHIKKNKQENIIKFDKTNYTFSKKNKIFFNKNNIIKHRYDDNFINNDESQFRII